MAHMLPPDDHTTRRAIAATCPRSFLFCVVTDVGRPDIDTDTDTVACRPLAITYRQGHGHAPAHGNHASGQRVRHALDDAARAVAILTHPANRTALEAERARALAWYRQETPPGRAHAAEVEVPDAPQPPFEMQYKGHWRERTGRPDRPELPCRPDPCEYGDVQEQPLRCVFRADKLEYGLVILDISDLDDVRYGFVAPAVRYTAEISLVALPHPHGCLRLHGKTSGQCLSNAQAVARLLRDPLRKTMGGILNPSSASFSTRLRKTADETLLMLTGRASTFLASRPD
ncbi:hypothetical protein LZ31DRAFT_570538 [Colletotrichum somersetense]|nr:hypothetical protein LZ31DRAFT_570538 [Colletotrichum somersetense]